MACMHHQHAEGIASATCYDDYFGKTLVPKCSLLLDSSRQWEKDAQGPRVQLEQFATSMERATEAVKKGVSNILTHHVQPANREIAAYSSFINNLMYVYLKWSYWQ